MRLDPHEDNMRNKLSSQRINIDTDQLWNKLEEFVPEQKPRRPKAVFLLWPLLFLSISLGLLSPYRYASAFTSSADNYQNEAFANVSPSMNQENVQETIIQSTFSDGEIIKPDKEFLKQPSNEAKPNFSKLKSHKSHENSASANKESTQNSIETRNKSGSTAAMENADQSISNWNVEREQPGFMIEPFDNLNTLEIKLLTSRPYKTKKLKKIIRPKPAQIVLSLGMSAGAVVAQHLQANTAETDLLNKYKKTDSGRELIGLQLGISYPLSKKFYLRSGLNYTRAATQLSLSEDRYSRIQTDGILGVWEDNQGNLHEVEGPVYATRKTNYHANWTSHHHMFDVPVSLGFRLLHYKRNLISIEAGATYHLMHTFGGAVWDSEFYLNHDESVSDSFNHNNFSARAALEWEYQLNTTYSLFAGVQATDILLKNAGIDMTTEKRLYLINGIIGVKMYPGNL